MFRMSRNTVTLLSGYLKDCDEMKTEGSRGREPISTEKQLCVFLCYVGGLDSITKIADRFGISESSVISCRNRVLNAIVNNLLGRFICWPVGQNLAETCENFRRRNGFPGIAGALDGTHIQITKPMERGDSYINRKKNPFDTIASSMQF